MTADEQIAIKANGVLKSGDAKQALAVLEELRGRQVKPLLYFYVLARCHRQTGEVGRECAALNNFCSGLFAELVCRKAAVPAMPEELRNLRQESLKLAIQGDHRRAIELMSPVVAWLLDNLKELQFDPFPPPSKT
jgi:hypothetical protein